MPVKTKHLLISWGLLILLATIWGSSFILMKKAMTDGQGNPLLSNTQVAALRMVIASAVMLPFVLRKFRVNLIKYAVPLAIVGWAGNGLPAFLFTTAQTELNSSITGVLNALTPLFTLMVAFFLYRKRYPVINYIGIVVALAGAMMLVFEHSHGISGAPLWAYASVALATVCYAISVNVIKNNLTALGSIQITGLAMVWVSPVCLAFLIYDGFFNEVLHSQKIQEGLPYVAVLAVLGTAVALILFNHLIKISNALFASSVTYLIPVVAVFWGFMDSEVISWLDLLFTAVIISGVYMVNKRKETTNTAVSVGTSGASE